MELDYNVSSGPFFLSSELVIGPRPGPGPELDNKFDLRTIVSRVHEILMHP